MDKRPGPITWSPDDGEMAGRIYSHDWSATPLGPADRWPPSLRTTLALILAMPSPATILWGPLHLQIYNDAYVDIAQDRHPDLLGRPVMEGWPDAYDNVIVPLLDAVGGGNSTQLTGFQIALRRQDGQLEERTFDTTWMPIHDELGSVVGALQTLTEVTDRSRAEAALSAREAQQTFLLKFSDALRSIGDAAAIRRTACALIGEHLHAAWAYYVDYEAEQGYGIVSGDYAEPGLPSLAGRYPFEAFRTSYERIGKGATWVMPDVAADRDLAGHERDFYVAQAVISWVNVPLLKDGRFQAAFCVVGTEPRDWSAHEVDLIEQVADRLWAAIARVRAETALRATEAQLAAAFESVPVGAAVIDTAGKAVFANAEYRRFLPTGVIPSRDPERVARWRAWDSSGRLLEPSEFPGARALRGERVKPGQEMLFSDDRGREIWTSVATVPIRDSGGQVTGLVTTISDIDVAKRATEALRQSEERLRQFGEASSDVLWIRDAETLRWTYLTPAFEVIYGLGREEVLTGNDFRRWAELILPEDREHALDSIRRVREGERVTFEYRIRRPVDGTVRRVQNTDFPIRDTDGRIYAIGGVGHDVTQEREMSDRLEVLVAELQHRTRNLLGVVRSVADRTARGSASLPDFLAAYRARLAALSRINSLLSKLEQGERVTFDAIIQAELSARGALDSSMGERVILDGPGGVRLRSATVQTFVLAIHELVTNAVKYGALSDGEGRLHVRWAVRGGEEGDERLHVEWTETGVNDMPGPGDAPRGGGSGRTLIEQALPYQLGAKTTYELGPDGIRCTIDLPLR